MMTVDEREKALKAMRELSDAFYGVAARIGVHPFIEFTGIMNEYILCCRRAHDAGVDFSDCNTHTGSALPIEPTSLSYINEKLECIFTGSSVMSMKEEQHG